ncbi:thiamine phosphate synthase [uncultured Roseobacter sp.]|uniref:thiamine phosphate synthase n=1 Tax=uncultured Roseobacter sp. TaxID=114847 RepID=UPI00260DB2CE|nr:thiamine phosphate synthase [uncultured Roseobacter sp.]
MLPPLCFITDADAGLPIPDQVEQAARGGAAWVQLRHKTLADQDFADLARSLKDRLAPLAVKLIINDRVEIARTIGAWGLHVGQSDGDPALIRRRIGPDMVMGLSIEAEDQMAAIPSASINYLGVGPVRQTLSKPDHAPPIGFEGLARIAAKTALPCMAIGGLTAADVPAVRAAGCESIAVISAISRDADLQSAARDFIRKWSI